MNTLDKEFEALSKRISDKILEAAKALREAQSLISDQEFIDNNYYDEKIKTIDRLYYMSNNHIESSVDELFLAIDNAGWHSSSMQC
jgi:hypothetical protein